MAQAKPALYVAMEDALVVGLANFEEFSDERKIKFIVKWFLIYHAPPLDNVKLLIETPKDEPFIIELARPTYLSGEVIDRYFSANASDKIRRMAEEMLNDIISPEWLSEWRIELEPKSLLWAPTRIHKDIVSKYGAPKSNSQRKNKNTTINYSYRSALGTERDLDARKIVIESIDELDTLLSSVDTGGYLIGHNSNTIPNEDIDSPLSGVEFRVFAQKLSEDLEAIKVELAKDKPSIVVIKKRRRDMKKTLEWGAKKMDKLTDSFSEAMGKNLSTALTATPFVIALPEILRALSQTLNMIARWFYAIF